jgi:hypothetical protein
MDTNYIMSVRFFPWWSDAESSQVVGLISMINSILKDKPNINNLVEIGSHLGESTTIFLGFENIHSIHCVDPWNQNPIYEKIFDARLEDFIKNNRCKKLKTISTKACSRFANESIDMVYIDGNHDYDNVKTDISVWYPKLISGGILAGHDYSIDHPGTKQAIDEFILNKNTSLKTFLDHSWYIIKE